MNRFLDKAASTILGANVIGVIAFFVAGRRYMFLNSALLVMTVVTLGFAITSLRNALPFWKEPTYSDDATYSIEGEGLQAVENANHRQIDWHVIASIVIYTVFILCLWTAVILYRSIQSPS